MRYTHAKTLKEPGNSMSSGALESFLTLIIAIILLQYMCALTKHVRAMSNTWSLCYLSFCK